MGSEPPKDWDDIIPLDVASQLHRGTIEGLEGILDPRIDAQLLSELVFPDVNSAVTEPLFSGTLHFVQIRFTVNAPPAPPATIPSASTADLLVAISYAEMAASRISHYAEQYGNNAIAISPEILQFDVDVTDEFFCNADLRGWVNEITAVNGLPGSDAVAVLNTSALINGNAYPSITGVPSYHAAGDIAYLYVDVSGTELTIDDSADLYALLLSHEIAEMTVDPASDLQNPEVCDPCAQGGTQYRAFFDAEGNYISTESSFPPGVAYEFFISAIVRPDSATGVVPTTADCAYPPPPQQG